MFNNFTDIQLTLGAIILALLFICLILALELHQARSGPRYFRSTMFDWEAFLVDSYNIERERDELYKGTNTLLNVLEEIHGTEFVEDWQITVIDAAMSGDTDRVKALLS